MWQNITPQCELVDEAAKGIAAGHILCTCASCVLRTPQSPPNNNNNSNNHEEWHGIKIIMTVDVSREWSGERACKHLKTIEAASMSCRCCSSCCWFTFSYSSHHQYRVVLERKRSIKGQDDENNTNKQKKGEDEQGLKGPGTIWNYNWQRGGAGGGGGGSLLTAWSNSRCHTTLCLMLQCTRLCIRYYKSVFTFNGPSVLPSVRLQWIHTSARCAECFYLSRTSSSSTAANVNNRKKERKKDVSSQYFVERERERTQEDKDDDERK